MWSRLRFPLLLFFSIVNLFAQGGGLGYGDTVVVSIPFSHSDSLLAGGDDDWDFTNYNQNSANNEDFGFTLNVSDTVTVDISLCNPITDFDTMLGVFRKTPDTTYVDTNLQCIYPEGGQGYSLIDCFSEDTDACTEEIGAGGVSSSLKSVIYGYELIPDVNRALQFDGVDDYVEMNSIIIPGVNDFSVSVWAKADIGLSGYREILSQTASGGSNFYIGHHQNGNIRVGDDWQDTGYAFPTDGEWHHYAVTKSAANTILYLDGSQVAEFGSAINNPDAQPFYIGAQSEDTGPTEFFSGLIDEVAIWIVTLSAADISGLYNNGNAVNANIDAGTYTSASGVKNYWRFNEDSGNIVQDNSGDDLSGTINGGAARDEYGTTTATYYIVVDSYSQVPAESPYHFLLNVEYTVPPYITGFALEENNNYVDISFNENVYDGLVWVDGDSLEVEDFSVSDFEQNGGSATGVVINEVIGGSGVTTVRLNLTLPIPPAGVETFKIKPADSNSIFDGGGTPMSDTSSTGLITLSGNSVAYVGFPWVEDENTYVRIVYNQGVYANNDSSGGLDKTDLSMEFSQNSGNATLAVIDSVRNTAAASLSGGEDTILVFLGITGTPSGVETVDFSPVDNASIYNKYGLPMSFSLNTGDIPLWDRLSPTIASAYISFDNEVVIIPTEAVYSDVDATNGLDSDDISLGFNQNSGTATNAIAQSVKDTDGNVASGGEDTLVIELNITNLPSGVETVEITPINNTSVYDPNGNAMPAAQTTGALTLNDKLPPEIDSTVSALATSNSYAAISISEGLYTNPTADAALLVTDLKLAFDDNGGWADSVTVLQIARPGGNSLLGGEDSLWIYLGVTGSPSGVERITISAEGDDAIYDPNGNAMHLSSSSGWLTLNPYPRFDSLSTELDDDNNFVMLVFSEGVYGSGGNRLEPSDLSAAFTQNNGNANGITIDTLKNVDEVSDLSGGEDSVIVYFSLTNPPASGVETIELKPANANSVYNTIGNPMKTAESSGLVTLNDKLPPFFLSAELSLDTAVTIVMSEGLYADEDGTEAIEIPDFRMDLKRNEGNATSAQITDFTKIDGSGLAGGEDTLLVHFTIDVLSSGVEEIEIKPADNAAFDKVGNPMDSALTTGYIKLNDLLPPSILDSSSLTTDNQIEVWISEGVYGSGSGAEPLDAFDFDISISQNGGNASVVDIGSVTTESNTVLTGGETKIRLHLDFNELPSGAETVKALPADTNSIFDWAGNPMEITEETPLFTLYDELPPTITNVNIENQDTLPLIKESSIELTLSEPLVSFDLSVVAKYTDSLKYSLDTSSTALTITVLPPLASLDTIVVTVDNMKDSANIVHDPQVIFTYYTPALGDFNWDDKIDVEDLKALVNAWYDKDYEYELGPVTGTIPHYIPQPDSVFDLDDGLAFTRMWYWINQLQGLSRPMLAEIGPQLEIEISSGNILIQPPAFALTGQLFLEYDPVLVDLNSPALSGSPSKIVLSKQERTTGRILFEYAGLTGNGFSELVFKKKTLGRRESVLNVSYKFYDEEGEVISQGSRPLTMVPVPEVFALHPVYPNPFNPATTIRFDVPVESAVPTILRVYDIAGRRVETLVDRQLEVGYHEFVWNGNAQSSGVYFAELLQGNQRLVQKMVLLK